MMLRVNVNVFNVITLKILTGATAALYWTEPKQLKEYYEIVGESRPLSAFFHKHADIFTEMHF